MQLFKEKFASVPYLALSLITASILLCLPTATLSANKTKPISEQRYGDSLRQEGRLVSLQISMGQPIRIFVIGKEEAKIDPSTLKVTIRRLKPYPGKILALDQIDNYFVVSEPTEFRNSLELEVTAKVKDADETFNFKMK